MEVVAVPQAHFRSRPLLSAGLALPRLCRVASLPFQSPECSQIRGVFVLFHRTPPSPTASSPPRLRKCASGNGRGPRQLSTGSPPTAESSHPPASGADDSADRAR
jgi:hypothetical protein